MLVPCMLHEATSLFKLLATGGAGIPRLLLTSLAMIFQSGLLIQQGTAHFLLVEELVDISPCPLLASASRAGARLNMLNCTITCAEAGLSADGAGHGPLHMNHLMLLHGVEVLCASPSLRENSFADWTGCRDVVGLHMLHPRMFVVLPTAPPIEDPAAHMACGEALVPAVLHVFPIVPAVLGAAAMSVFTIISAVLGVVIHCSLVCNGCSLPILLRSVIKLFK